MIHLDNDILVLNSLNRYRRYEFALGWPAGEWLGNMLLIAHRDARFLAAMLDTYKETFKYHLVAN